MKQKRTWIVIADGARARIMERIGVRSDLKAVPGSDRCEFHAMTRDLGRERPARTHDRIGPGRHAMEPRQDAHDRLETLFAHKLVETLERALADDRYDALVIIAPPTTLGDIRTAMSSRLRAAVISEIAKDLTKASSAHVLTLLDV